MQAWFIEAEQSSLQTNCGSAGCVSVSRAFCCLGWIPSYTFSGGSGARCCTEKSLCTVSGMLDSGSVCCSPLRALQWLMSTGVALLASAENQMLPLLPPISFAGGRQAKKRNHSSSALGDDS